MRKIWTMGIIACMIVLAGQGAVFGAAEIRSAQARKTTVLIDGEEIGLQNPLTSITWVGGDSPRTYMPLREILESLGYGVFWDADGDRVLIESPSALRAEWRSGGADVISNDVPLGYMNIQLAALEEDEHTKWSVVAQPYKGITLKEEAFTDENDGKTYRAFKLDADRTMPEGRMAAILQQTQDGKPTGKYVVLVINIFTAPPDRKPVIYLYPEKETDVTVKLGYDGVLDCTYPAYDKETGGWSVTAHPDGTLINKADGLEYSYLFWEGHGASGYDFSEGFVVKGEDTAAFLRESLSFMGLTPREYNEFIVYWLPQMQSNQYNLISFQKEAYAQKARLEISPPPDSVLRVFMAYKPLDKYTEILPQKLEAFERKGFSVIEWGGAEVK